MDKESSGVVFHPYQAWLQMGHVDDANIEACKVCGLVYEEFKAKPRSCREEKEDREIARKKLDDDWRYGSSRGYPPYY